MKREVFIGVTIAVALIIYFEWHKIKQYPRRDKAAFFILLTVGWLLSMIELSKTPGPTRLIETIFRPFIEMIEK